MTLVEPLKNNINVSKNIKYTVFLDNMIKFCLLPRVINKSPEELTQELNINPTILKYLLDTFSKPSFTFDDKLKHIKSNEHLLKNIYYIIALAFFLYDFKFDALPLCESLKIDTKQMYFYLKELSCEFPNIKTEIIDDKKIKNIKDFLVELKAPLKFSVSVFRKKGR